MFSLKETGIHGCFEIQPNVIRDTRGSFTKIFHTTEFSNLGLETNFAEEYYTHSRRDVIRGMHFQTPPSDHVKVVYCVHGEVLDVILDLREGSPTYGKHVTIKLSNDQGNCAYIPKGLAHGFCVTSDSATLVYKVTSTHDPKNDQGVRWNSFGFNWPTENPVISERDANLPSFKEFNTPFKY